MSEPQLIARLREASRQTVRRLGLLQGHHMETRCTPAQCHTLLLLSQRGTLTVGEIATALGLDKSTVSRAVQPLLARRLILVDAQPQDRRSKPLRLTERGRALVGRVNDTADHQVGSALDAMTEAERQTVVEGMELYARALERSGRVTGLTFRPIQASDDPAMADVIQRVMTEYGAVGAGFSIEDAEVHEMSRAYSGDRAAYFVVTNGDRFLGGAGIDQLVGAEPHICELKKMYIRPEGRGLGIGRRLMEMCLEAARNAGFTLCYLETLEHMTQARNLYEKAGFARIDRPLGATGHHGCNSWYTMPLA